MMKYLNQAALNSLSTERFQNQAPYPWAHIENSLTDEGYELLRATLPAVDGFDKHTNMRRAHGQMPHNRFMLHYKPGLELATPWQEFLAELNSPEYQSFLRRLLGNRSYIPTFSWHYAWQGCSVSPHCDAARKRATHIFHFNDTTEWDQAWGGETLILASQRPIPTRSAPTFDDLTVMGAHGPAGNGSLLFQRTDQSWHGVKPLTCPEGKLRKIFCVTVNVPTAQVLWRRLRGKDPDGFPLARRAS
jgi:hypothetical protein